VKTVATSTRIVALTALVAVTASVAPVTVAQDAGNVPGRISFVRDGDVWLWQDEGSRAIIDSGMAMDPSLSPDRNAVAFVERGGSFSNLVIHDLTSQRSNRITDHEPFVEAGSPDYVASSFWVIDPSWSESGQIGFISDRDSPDRLMRLWLMDDPTSRAELAPTDGQDTGGIEQLELSRDGDAAVYTVLAAGGELGGSTYVAYRLLDTGASYPIAEGVQGAYDGTLSPDGEHLAVSIRDDGGVSDLWIIDVETGEGAQVTDGAQATNASWSPDGEWLAYMTPDDRSFRLLASPVDAEAMELSGEPRELVAEPGIDATSGLSWIE
jgi:TolB protein